MEKVDKMIIIWLIVAIAIAIGILAAIIKYVFKQEEAARYASKIAESFIVGLAIGFSTIIILASFEVYKFSFWGIFGFLLITLILISLYKSGGPGVIYMAAIFVLIFGYLFTGPYSGYLKTYIGALRGPLDIAIYNARVAGHDLFLIITNPQEYLAEKQRTQVKLEESVSYPQGIEITSIIALPDSQISGGEFMIQALVENKGGLKAEDLKIKAKCKSLCKLPEDEEVVLNYTKNKTEKYWSGYFSFGPFIAIASKKSDYGKKAEVEVKLSYLYSASSNLVVNVMKEEEINRLLMNHELTFQTSTATSKVSPAVVAISVGRQPLYANRRTPLIISIVNKHLDGKVKLKENLTKLEILIPKSIASGVECSSLEKKKELKCGTTETENYTSISCNFTKNIEIMPLSKASGGEKNYRYYDCYFIPTIKGDAPSRSDVITAKLTNFSIEVSEEGGAILIRGGELYPEVSTDQAVTVFRHADFKGYKKSFNESVSDLTKIPFPGDGSWDNRISSMIIRAGCMVTIFQDRNYGGYSKTFIAEEEDLYIPNLKEYPKPGGGTWNDKTSSIWIDCVDDNLICASNLISKEYCDISGTKCSNDQVDELDCVSEETYRFEDWKNENVVCLAEGDGCERAGQTVGQCIRVNLSLIEDEIIGIWIRSRAECKNGLDVYGCNKTSCNSDDWKIIRDNNNGNVSIFKLTSDDLSLVPGIKLLDICSDGCDHKIDWIEVEVKEAEPET